MNLREAIPNLAQMSREEVLRIFHEFQDYVENMEHEAVEESPEFIAELERRSALNRANPERMLTWEEVLSRSAFGEESP